MKRKKRKPEPESVVDIPQLPQWAQSIQRSGFLPVVVIAVKPGVQYDDEFYVITQQTISPERSSEILQIVAGNDLQRIKIDTPKPSRSNQHDPLGRGVTLNPLPRKRRSNRE